MMRVSKKPTWNYVLNDLAFLSLRDLVISGKANEQDIIDFKHQLKLKDEQYKKVCDINRKAIEYVENMPYLQEIDEEFENIYGEVYFTYKEWNDNKLLEILKGDDEIESVEKE